MDVFTLVEGYMNRLFSDIDGMKLLLVDRETVNYFKSKIIDYKHIFFLLNLKIQVWNYKFSHVSI